MPSIALVPALAVIAGTLCGLHGGMSPRPLIFLLPLVCLAAIVSLRFRRRTSTIVVLALGLAIAGCVLAADAQDRALYPRLRAILDAEFGHFAIDSLGPAGSHTPVRIRAVLLEDAAERETFATLRVSVTAISIRDRWQQTGAGVTLSVGGSEQTREINEWRTGRTIEAPVLFRRPARYLNDGVPDFERDLALDGTALFGSIKSGLLIDVVAKGSVVDELGADARAFVRRAVSTWVAPNGTVSAAIVSAVLIGDRTGIPDEIRDRLQAAGTYHVIAISGGNIAVLVGIGIGTLMLVGVRGRPAAVLSIAMLLIYAQIVTAGPSVWRATLMALLHLTARAADHRTPTWQAAAVAAGVMLLARPLDIRDPGFLLTFGATAALLKVAEYSTTILPRSRIAAWLLVSVVASAAVEIALLPVGASTFSRVTGAGVLLNLLAVPLMGVVQAAGIAATSLDVLGIDASIPGWIAHAAAASIVESARLVDVWPWLTKSVPPPSLVTLAVYYVALTLMVAAKGRARIAGAAGTASAMILIVSGGSLSRWSEPPNAGLRLTLFDVGQGESMLLESANVRTLIDTGGAPFGSGGFDIGARVLAPALWTRGVRDLDALVVTHGDPDHLGGAPSLLDSFPVSQLWLGVPVPRHVPSQELVARAVKAGASVRERRAGERIGLGEVQVRVLHPPPPDWERQRVRNDDSIVLEVVYGDVALLLTGDVGADVERAILPHLTPARIRVLKIGHHGSRSSSSRELLEGWRPHFALISCGRGNTFGHPAPEVLRRLEGIGAEVFRTDRDGQITVETDGRSVYVKTFAGGRI